jgi:hypothetical protein
MEEKRRASAYRHGCLAENSVYGPIPAGVGVLVAESRAEPDLNTTWRRIRGQQRAANLAARPIATDYTIGSIAKPRSVVGGRERRDPTPTLGESIRQEEHACGRPAATHPPDPDTHLDAPRAGR